MYVQAFDRGVRSAFAVEGIGEMKVMRRVKRFLNESQPKRFDGRVDRCKVRRPLRRRLHL